MPGEGKQAEAHTFRDNQKMVGDISLLTTGELEILIGELENSYAEMLGGNESSRTLHHLWNTIRRLKTELTLRKAGTGV